VHCTDRAAREPGTGVTTSAPLPEGLEPRSGGACAARTAAAARAAVKRSEGWLASGGADDFFLAAHWVREGER